MKKSIKKIPPLPPLPHDWDIENNSAIFNILISLIIVVFICFCVFLDYQNKKIEISDTNCKALKVRL